MVDPNSGDSGIPDALAPDVEPVLDDEQVPDLEYDLAHEAATDGVPVQSGDPTLTSEAVATQTEDYDGDYSYDLAHDIPRA
jgi:hypothetical protein